MSSIHRQRVAPLVVSLALALALAIGAPTSWADEPDEATRAEDEEASDEERGGANPADRAAAESLFKVGEGLFGLGQLAEACEKLQGSVDAHFTLPAALLLAECQEQRGLIASAWATYREAAARMRKLDDPRAEATAARADELFTKVPRLTLLASSKIPNLEIVRGETHFGEGVLGVALAVDPGTHRIEARAPGFLPWSTEVTLRASERKTLTIPALVPTSESTPARSPQATSRMDTHGPLWTAGFVTGGLGLATIAAGALTGGFAAAEVRAAEDDPALCGPDRRCTASGLEAIERADRLAIASTVLLGVGGAALLGGFVMVLLDEPAATEAAWLSPWVSPEGSGLTFTGSF